jgi:hypothetical protein
MDFRVQLENPNVSDKEQRGGEAGVKVYNRVSTVTDAG